MINKTNRFTKVAGISTAVSLVAMLNIAMIMAAPTYGVWTGVTTSVTGLVTTLQNALMSIVIPVAAVVLVICFIGMFVSQDPKKVQSFRSWAFRVFIGIVGIFGINFIITLAQSIGQSL